MLLSLTADYFILVFCLCIGVIQIASAFSGLNGLLFIRSRTVSYILGIAVPTGAFTWFIHVGNVGIPGDLGGVEGSQQFLMFWGGAGAATILTGVLASLTQRGRKGTPTPERGLDGLREATFLELLRARLQR